MHKAVVGTTKVPFYMFCHNMFTTPPPKSVTTPNQITFIPHVTANRVATI